MHPTHLLDIVSSYLTTKSIRVIDLDWYAAAESSLEWHSCVAPV